jgi:transcription elongation factor SPT5
MSGPSTPGGYDEDTPPIDGEVIVIAYVDPQYNNRTGVMKSLKGSKATVLVLDFNKEIDVSLSSLKVVAPEKGDEVKVMSGQDKDAIGSLLSTDDEDGIVRVKGTGEVKFVSLKSLAKLHKY